jgi:aryl-alcohol dehydrogenase-like predicted oxidoreductase
MWYLHGPDRQVPYERTLEAVNNLYKEGKFKRFGISNYSACVRPMWFRDSLRSDLVDVAGRLPRSS